MSIPCTIVCRSCSTFLYDFSEVKILEKENKLIVRPDVNSPLRSLGQNVRIDRKEARRDRFQERKRRLRQWKLSKIDFLHVRVVHRVQTKEDTSHRNCKEKIGIVLADAISETSIDEIRPKYVTVILKNGENRRLNKTWDPILQELESNGIQKINQKEFLKQVFEPFYETFT